MEARLAVRSALAASVDLACPDWVAESVCDRLERLGWRVVES